MRRSRNRPPHDDLFQIFPDLPWPRTSTRGETVQRIRQQIEDVRIRAAANIARQKAATERVRARVAARLRALRGL